LKVDRRKTGGGTKTAGTLKNSLGNGNPKRKGMGEMPGRYIIWDLHYKETVELIKQACNWR